MANSFVSVRAVGGQTNFPFNFPNGYLAEEHIHVYVDGVEVARTISGGVAIIAPCAEGQEVVVARHSPVTPFIAFEDGSILNKQNIDVQNKHAFMMAEEAAEQRDFFALGDIDMNYHKIIHVAPGEDQYDVVNKGQFDYFLQINEDAAQRAEDAADAAAVSAQQAASSASAALASQNAAATSADFAADTVSGFDAHAETKKAEVTAEGDFQEARIIEEGDIQYARSKAEADRAQGYAEILERPYEDMGAHQIQQGYPPVPSFSSMWAIVDGGVDPVDGVTVWNAGDILLYSVQAAVWSRLTGSILGGGGDPVPVEILDDLIMQQGKKIRFRVDEFTDTVGMTLDSAGDVVIGEIPSTPSTGTPAPKIGFAATEVYHITGTDATGAAVKHRVYDQGFKPTPADIGSVNKAGDTMTGALKVDELWGATTNMRYVSAAAENSEGIYWGNPDQWSRIHANAGLVQVTDGSGAIWRVYHQGFKPTAADVGAVNKDGDTMTGTLNLTETALSTTPSAMMTMHGDASVTPGTHINLRSMREANGATRLWEKIANGSLYYGAGDTGAANKLRVDGFAGELYCVDGTKRVYHQGFKPTAAEVGAAPTTHTHTAAQGNQDIVAGSYGQVGTYAMAVNVGSAEDQPPGTLLAGSSLRYSHAGGWGGGPALPGTWKSVGYGAGNDDSDDYATTVWIRVS